MALAAPTFTLGTTTTRTSPMTILLRSPVRSSQIYGWPCSCPQIQKKGSLICQTVKASTGGGDEAVKSSAKAKYIGTLKREKQLTEMIEKMVMEAKEVCKGDERSDECKVAWDEVEEVSQAKADLRLKLELQQDPLESFCTDHPETDECRIDED